MDRNAPPNPPPHSPTSAGERRLARLVVPAPSAYEPHQRIDWIHDPLPPADADDADPDETAYRARPPRRPDA